VCATATAGTPPEPAGAAAAAAAAAAADDDDDKISVAGPAAALEGMAVAPDSLQNSTTETAVLHYDSPRALSWSTTDNQPANLDSQVSRFNADSC
jgi:hypothetical protein